MNKITIFIFIIILIIIKINAYINIESFETDDINLTGFLKIYNNFLTHEECDNLIKSTNYNFIDSTVLNDKNNSDIDKKTRSSSSYYFKKAENPIILKIENMISKELNVPIENIEPIQMTIYNKNQEYLPHYDYIFNIENQRTHTFVVYLNTLSENEGGSTHFVSYNKKIYPEKGKAICFKNTDTAGNLNKMSLHGGEKVLNDNTKYILSIWIRQNKFIN
jgi:prolyl 4-hydroxylase